MAEIVYKAKTTDTMELTEAIMTYKNALDIPPNAIAIDKIGIGRGVFDMAYRTIQGLQGINVGEKAMDESRFNNLKAELAWKVREWVLSGGKLKRDEDWYQIAQIKYKTKLDGTNRGRLEIISKDELLRRGIDSPDIYDALALTFATPDIVKMSEEDEMRLKEETSPMDKHGMFLEI